MGLGNEVYGYTRTCLNGTGGGGVNCTCTAASTKVTVTTVAEAKGEHPQEKTCAASKAGQGQAIPHEEKGQA